MRSYFQKITTYAKKMAANPKMSNTAIYDFYKNTPNGMRKTDYFKVITKIRDVSKFTKMMKNSNMKPKTLKSLQAAANRAAKTDTVRGKKEYRKGLSKKAQKIFDERGAMESVNDIKDRTFVYHPEAGEGVYVDFYGE